MSDILIKNMEIPKDSKYVDVRIFRDGWATTASVEEPFYKKMDVVEVPTPHGRLIDADALKDTLDYYIREAGWSDEINEALTWVRDEFIDHEPTVIEAEGT